MSPFFFYGLYLAWVNLVPLDARTKLLQKIIEYGTEGVNDSIIFTDLASRALFPQIKSSIDASKARYDKAVENGKKGGRPSRMPEDNKYFIDELHYMVNKGDSAQNIAKHFGVSLSTAYRYIKAHPLPKSILEVKASGRPYSIGIHYIPGGKVISSNSPNPLTVEEIKDKIKIDKTSQLEWIKSLKPGEIVLGTLDN